MKSLSGEKQKIDEMRLHDELLAGRYDSVREKWRFSMHYHEEWMRQIIGMIPRPFVRMLDFCCGTSLAFPFAEAASRGLEYYGIDISESMLAIGREKFGRRPNFRTYRQDGENLTFSGFFDVVVARGAIHHLPDPAKGLRSISRALRSSGFLVISEPASNVLVKAVRNAVYKSSPYFTQTHKSFTVPELKGLLKGSGFEIVVVKHLGLLAYVFGFPDVLPVLMHVPYGLARFLEMVDEKLLKVPLIRDLSWSVIILARKTG